MLIGIPKEIKPDEYRAGLVPSTIRELLTRGHEVAVEQGVVPVSNAPKWQPVCSMGHDRSLFSVVSPCRALSRAEWQCRP
jgi:hypothetical protein